MKTIISVDIQPDSKPYIQFNLVEYIAYIVEQLNEGNKVIIFYNSFGDYNTDRALMIDFFSDLLFEHFNSVYYSDFEIDDDEVDEYNLYSEIDQSIGEVFANGYLRFVDKQYANFRAFEGYSDVGEDEIVELIKNLLADDKFSLSEYSEEEIKEKFDNNVLKVWEAGDYFGFDHNVSTILSNIDNEVILFGGGEYECLFEIEIELRAREIEYARKENFIY